MSKWHLRSVRENTSVKVYTEHTDRIHPLDLSESLAKNVGKDQFRVSLRKNIYVIYIDARSHESNTVSTADSLKGHADTWTQKEKTISTDDKTPRKSTIEPQTYQQRLEDFKNAEEILCDVNRRVSEERCVQRQVERREEYFGKRDS